MRQVEQAVAGVLAAGSASDTPPRCPSASGAAATACTAGTCYEVQPFVGAEVRLVSRF